jgi:hypothetical protein
MAGPGRASCISGPPWRRAFRSPIGAPGAVSRPSLPPNPAAICQGSRDQSRESQSSNAGPTSASVACRLGTYGTHWLWHRLGNSSPVACRHDSQTQLQGVLYEAPIVIPSGRFLPSGLGMSLRLASIHAGFGPFAGPTTSAPESLRRRCRNTSSSQLRGIEPGSKRLRFRRSVSYCPICRLQPGRVRPLIWRR